MDAEIWYLCQTCSVFENCYIFKLYISRLSSFGLCTLDIWKYIIAFYPLYVWFMLIICVLEQRAFTWLLTHRRPTTPALVFNIGRGKLLGKTKRKTMPAAPLIVCLSDSSFHCDFCPVSVQLSILHSILCAFICWVCFPYETWNELSLIQLGYLFAYRPYSIWISILTEYCILIQMGIHVGVRQLPWGGDSSAGTGEASKESASQTRTPPTQNSTSQPTWPQE